MEGPGRYQEGLGGIWRDLEASGPMGRDLFLDGGPAATKPDCCKIPNCKTTSYQTARIQDCKDYMEAPGRQGAALGDTRSCHPAQGEGKCLFLGP